MYTNGNLEAHLAALLFLGTMGLLLMFSVVTLVLVFARRAWVRLSPVRDRNPAGRLRSVAGGILVHQLRPHRGARRRQVLLCTRLPHRLLGAERGAGEDHRRRHRQGEFCVVTLRTHFDERTIAPWRGNSPLRPEPPSLTLIDGNGRQYPVSSEGQKAWEVTHREAHYDGGRSASWRVVRNNVGVRRPRERTVAANVGGTARLPCVRADRRRDQPAPRQDLLCAVHLPSPSRSRPAPSTPAPALPHPTFLRIPYQNCATNNSTVSPVTGEVRHGCRLDCGCGFDRRCLYRRFVDQLGRNRNRSSRMSFDKIA